jgi:hypothetical protein
MDGPASRCGSGVIQGTSTVPSTLTHGIRECWSIYFVYGTFCPARLPTTSGSRSSVFSNQTRLLGNPVRPWLRHVEAGVLEEDSRPVTVGFEPVDHPRIGEPIGRPRVCDPTGRFAFQHLAAHHDPVEAGHGFRRHAKRVALGRRQIPGTFG